MARYTDIDKLIAEYDRVHVGPAGGARKLMVEAPIADVAPRAEVEKIIEEVKKKAEAYFWHHDSVATAWFMEFCDELKKKYAEGRNESISSL